MPGQSAFHLTRTTLTVTLPVHPIVVGIAVLYGLHRAAGDLIRQWPKITIDRLMDLLSKVWNKILTITNALARHLGTKRAQDEFCKFYACKTTGEMEEIHFKYAKLLLISTLAI